MKTHTYFLSGKALAIVGGSLLMSGALVFVVGLFVGLMIQAPAQAAAEGRLRDLIPAAAQPIASTDANVALQRAETPAAWPFSVPAPVAAPAADSAPAAAPDSVPAPGATKPKPDTTAKRRAISDVAYIVPAAEPPRRMIADDAPFTVHVGAFRVQSNAQNLIERLRSAGYRPVETVRLDGGRELHVVSIGGYVGRRAAIMAAERIGDAEHLVATAVPAVRARARR
jgi:cell division septation protein DedD